MANRQRCIKKFGSAWNDLYQIISRVPNKYVFGEWEHIWDFDSKTLIGGHPSYSLAGRLSKTVIYNHLLATSKFDYFWYTNSLFEFNGSKLALLQLDIDFHTDQDIPSDASVVMDSLLADFPFLNLNFAQSSTNGSGIHMYIVVAFDLFMPFQEVKDIIKEFEGKVSQSSNECAIRFKTVSKCHEVRGYPNTDKCGDLVKFPVLSNESEALALIDLFLNPIPYKRLLPEKYGLPFPLSGNSVDSSDIDTQLNNIIGLILNPSKGNLVASGNNNSLPGNLNSNTSLFLPTSLSSLNTKKERRDRRSVPTDLSSQDAFKRMQGAASNLIIKLNRPITSQELLEAYQEIFPERGPAHKKRNKRAEQVSEYFNSTFNPSKAENPLKYIPELTPLINPDLIEKHLRGKRSLLIEDIALVLFLIRQNAKETISISPTDYLLSASR